MLGPVASAELLRAGRRGKAHVLRWAYAAWLVLQLLYLYDATHARRYYNAPRPSPVKAAADFGQRFRDLVLGQQFVLIALVTPAFVAGAVTDEKTRGTLQALLTAHVTPADVVLGKLLGRCAQVAALALVPLPLLAVVGPIAGVPPEFLVVLVAVTALVLFGLGGVSVLASVWTRQTRAAVILTYVVLGGGLAVGAVLADYGWLPAGWRDDFDPVRVLRPALDREDPAEAFRRLGRAAVAWGGLGAVATGLAVWRLRPAYLRQLEARPRGRLALGRLVARPRPTRDALAWKERYVGRRVPPWVGVPVVAGLGGAVTAYALSGVGPLAAAMGRGGPGLVAGYVLMQEGFYALLVATLVVGVRCSGTITGERERQTWDGLMTTPMTVPDIVRGKLRGILRATWPYVLAYWLGAGLVAGIATSDDPLLPVAAVLIGAGVAGLVVWQWRRLAGWAGVGLVLLPAGVGGLNLAYIAAIGLGVTWLTMYFLGAVGLYCSAKSRSSWRSLLGTVVLGYLGGSALFCVSFPVSCIFTLLLAVVAAVLNELIRGTGGQYGPFAALEALAGVFYTAGAAVVLGLVARSVVLAAENAVAKFDRIPPNWVRMIEYDLPQHGPQVYRRRLPR
ncbi:MAG TPA: ABC transporter permease subunit [Gemmataceae bacterium]|jgi:ABC-type transport system involved in multi-copper enzyme maturation permease subunit